MSSSPAIVAEGLYRSFGETRALDGLDLSAERGSVLALLGPNGAGKTTAVRIFTTLLRPDSGRAEVAGLDCVHDAARLRSRIGLTGQYAAVDEYLTGRENIEMVGRLSRLPRAEVDKRASELIERFDLGDAGDRLVKTYSGGMRRKLDLAASLVATPEVVFLDEPTTGLDPRARLIMWDIVRELVAEGITVLLTTQYLEEADQLADQIAVMDQGKVIARGTSDELKAQVGGDRLEAHFTDDSSLDPAAAALRSISEEEPHVDRVRRVVSVPSSEGARTLVDAVREFDSAGVEVADLSLRRPTLDDVFLRLTGHAAEEELAEDEPAGVTV